MEEFFNSVSHFFLTFGKNILVAVIVFFVAQKLIKWAMKLIDKAFNKAKVEPMIVHFTESIAKVLMYVILGIVIITILGIPSTAFIAAFGTVGLTIGLALQGSLSNFAGGVLILIFHPFKVGDYIVATGNEGVVTGIDIFYTRLNTVDNKLVIIPNGALANSNVVNVTAEEYRRVDINVGISYESDIKEAKKVLMDVIAKNDKVITDKGITVFVSSLDSSAVTLETRVWVDKADYWDVKWALTEDYKYALDNAGIEIPFTQVTVSYKKDEK